MTNDEAQCRCCNGYQPAESVNQCEKCSRYACDDCTVVMLGRAGDLCMDCFNKNPPVKGDEHVIGPADCVPSMHCRVIEMLEFCRERLNDFIMDHEDDTLERIDTLLAELRR